MFLCSLQVNLGETLLEAETSENVESPVNCFRKLFGDFYSHCIYLETSPANSLYSHIYLYILCLISVCDVLPLVIKNVDMRLPANLMQKYMLKAAEFYIGYVTRGSSCDAQIHGNTVFSKNIFIYAQANCTYIKMFKIGFLFLKSL